MEQKTPREDIMAEAKTGLMAGKRGLIMGVANDHSIAWGIAQMLAAPGRRNRLYLSGRRPGKAAGAAGRIASARKIVLPADVESDEQLDAVFATLEEGMGQRSTSWSTAIAFSDREELKGRYVDTTRANFLKSLDISCYSFTAVAQRAPPPDDQGRRHGDADLSRRPARDAQLQCDGRGQGGAGSLACAISPPIWAATISASTPSRPGRCAPWPARAVGDARMVFKWNKSACPAQAHGRT